MASVDDAMKTMVANLEAKTGKNLAAWVKLAKASGQTAHGKIVAHLKSEHGLTHGYANLIAHNALQSAATNQEAQGVDLVAEQYKGAKAGLRPIYEALLKAIQGFGTDLEISPKKGYVSLRRSKQFALVQPSTATRLDLGLNLKGVAPSGRLEASGSFNAMCTHRVRLEKSSDVDKELLGWLRAAYDKA